MKIFVTGADGLLGSNLVRMLIEQNYEVTALIHPNSNSTTLQGLAITLIKGNILNPSDFLHHMNGNHVVIHAAALTDVWPNRSEKVRSVNIEGTRKILDTAVSCNVRRFIYVSTASIQMDNHGADYGLDYIDSKYEAQQLVQQLGNSGTIETISVQPTFMIGPYDSKPGSGKMIQTLAKGKLKFYSAGGKNFVFVKDVAQAIINAITLGTSGEAYVAGGVNMDYKSFFTLVANIVHQPAPKFKIPNWLILLVGRLGSLMGTITGRPPMLSYPMARISLINQYVDPSKTIEVLQMPQTDIKVAVEECYRWLKENGYC